MSAVEWNRNVKFLNKLERPLVVIKLAKRELFWMDRLNNIELKNCVSGCSRRLNVPDNP